MLTACGRARYLRGELLCFLRGEREMQVYRKEGLIFPRKGGKM